MVIGVAAVASVSLGPIGVGITLLLTTGFLLLDVTAAVDAWEAMPARSVIGAIVAILAVSVLGVWRGSLPEVVLDPRMQASTAASAVVRSMPQPGARFDMALVQVETIATTSPEPIAVSQPVLALIPVSTRANVGDRLWLEGSFSSLAELEPGFRDYVAGRGAVGVYRAYAARIDLQGHSPLRWLVDLQREVARRFRHALPGDVGELAAGIVSGDDSGLSEDASVAFRTVGLSHLTAVSGQNIAILAGLVVMLVPGRSVRRSALFQVGTLAIVWLYVGMTGFGPPAIRAGLFLTASLLAVRLGRRPDYLTIVALVSGGMLLVEPTYVRSVSFWLSMAASAALVTAFGWPTGGMRRWIMRAFMALITAQLATLPIAVAVFGTWSIGSIPANLLVGPLMELAFPLCFALAIALSGIPVLAPMLAWLVEIPLAATLAIAKHLAERFPAQDLAAGGTLVLMAMTVPCLVSIALLSEDARRWLAREQERRTGDPVGAVALVLGLAGGGMMVVLIAGMVR